jgi:hypothetical protein
MSKPKKLRNIGNQKEQGVPASGRLVQSLSPDKSGEGK